MTVAPRDLVAVVLAGGLGTRLRPVLGDRPKALAPVAERPFIRWVLDAFEAAGVRRVVVAVGYRAGDIRAALGSRHGSLELSYSEEPEPLGTAGALRFARDQIDSDAALVANGDSLVRGLDFGRLTRAHDRSGAPVTVAAVSVLDASRFGRMEIDPSGQVTSFLEKGDNSSAGPAWINAGVYLCSARFLDSLPGDTPLSMERQVLPGWVGRGLRAFVVEGGALLDIGTPESFAAATSWMAPIGAGSSPC